MAGCDEATRSLAWALASGHTALFVLLPLLLIQGFGQAGALLGGLNTFLGAGLYVLLWALAWLAHRDVLCDGVGALTGARGIRLGTAFLAGAFIGGGFVLVVVLSAAVSLRELGLVPLGLMATGFAVLLGGGVGVLFALLDGILMRWASRVADAYTDDPRGPDGTQVSP